MSERSSRTVTPGPTSPAEARERFRAGLRTETSGWLPGYTQANLIAVPSAWAYDMLLFAHRNPKPCPILDVTEPGDPATALAEGADVRTDLPGYRIWRDGELVDEVADARPYWPDDLVAFLIGCSLTFEAAMVEAGIRLRHLEESGVGIAAYVTNRRCRPAGRVGGDMVVSMRPIRANQVARAVEVTSRYPDTHGGPVHVGAPEALGIVDLARPDFGVPVDIRDNEIPVFWGCGVTPQRAVIESRPPLAISHVPGQMFITDEPSSRYAR